MGRWDPCSARRLKGECPPLQTTPTKQNIRRANTGGKAMKVFAATLTLLVSGAAAAQECQTCSMADACITTYLKAASHAQKATKQAIRDCNQHLHSNPSPQLSTNSTLPLQHPLPPPL